MIENIELESSEMYMILRPGMQWTLVVNLHRYCS